MSKVQLICRTCKTYGRRKVSNESIIIISNRYHLKKKKRKTTNNMGQEILKASFHSKMVLFFKYIVRQASDIIVKNKFTFTNK